MTTRGRRQFLKQLGAGSAVISMPAFLAGCGVLPASDLSSAPPENPYLAWFGIDDAMLARVMSELTANGATHADIYFQHRRSHRLRLDDGQASAPQSTIEQGVGLRVVINGRTGYASTEELTLPGMLKAAREAAQIASGGAAVSPSQFLAIRGNNFYPVTSNWSDISVERRWFFLEQVAARARAAEPSVSEVTVDWHDSDERILIATLDGNLITDRRPLTQLSAQVEVQRGSEAHSGFFSVSARQDIDWYDNARLDAVATAAVDRALQRFDARRPPPGEMPVVLAAGTSGIVLHEALGHALEADFSKAGTGPYAELLGERVASPLITVIDDATLSHQRGSMNVDDEGVAGQRNVLIENGVLRSFLHDRISAAAAGVLPTGSGRRESFRFSPLPRMTCTHVANGKESHDELLASVERGIWAKTFADGRVDPATGDFSFLVNNGWFIENGRASYPIRDVRLSGNGPAMLRNVQRLANDGSMDQSGWTCGKRGQRVPVSHGMPTALVAGLRIHE